MKDFKNIVSRGVDWAIALSLATVAGVIFFCGLVDYAMPGESATLLSAWNGLEALPPAKYPLMGWFYHLLPLGQALAPVCGIICVLAIFHLVTFYIREQVGGEFTERVAISVSRVGGVVASLMFVFTPCVRESATHLDPRLFDSTLLLVGFTCLLGIVRLPKALAWLMPALIAVILGFGVTDSITFAVLFPLYLAGIWIASLKRHGKRYCVLSISLFLTIFLCSILTLLAYAKFTHLLDPYYKAQREILSIWLKTEGTYTITMFSTLPFFIALLSCRRAFTGEHSWMQISYHGAMTFVNILALVTSFSASSIMHLSHYAPVTVTIYAACTAGYLLAFWYSLTCKQAVNESIGLTSAQQIERSLGWAAGGAFLLLLVISATYDFFMKFDSDRGRFEDVVARRIVADLGDRDWFVTDGTLDTHLRLAAREAGKELNLICLQKDRDSAYCAELAALAESKGLGEHAEHLRKWGINAFLQHWFAADSNIVNRVAIYGAPHLWSYARCKPVPELFFFGGDPARLCNDQDARLALLKVLDAPEGWGSHKMLLESSGSEIRRDSLEIRRLNLRIHLGMMTCSRGVYELLAGRAALNRGEGEAPTEADQAEATRHFDAAFDYFEFVLNNIDADNVSARFNECDLVDRRNKKALSHVKEINAALEAMERDPSRRYRLHALTLIYGDIVNPDLFLKQGLAQVKSAEFFDLGVDRIRDAINLVPFEQRAWHELTVLAPLFADARGDKREEARRIYSKTLEDLARKNIKGNDLALRVALLGIAQLEMLSGNSEKAREYLERATEQAGNDSMSYVAIGMLRLMRNELEEADRVLTQATDLQHDNMKAWALRANVVLRMLDETTKIADPSDRELAQVKLTEQLEEKILPTMAKIRPDDVSYLSTLAFSKIRKGGRENLESAREDLVKVATLRPESSTMGDMLLNLDVNLNRREDAEARANQVLRVDPNAPLANWIIGSLALSDGNIEKAEHHLRISANAPRPDLRALNDLAELYRRKKEYAEAEIYARRATEMSPDFYVVWETLGVILLEGGNPDHLPIAEAYIVKACDLSPKGKNGAFEDPRMLISLARVQLKLNKIDEAKKNIRIVRGRVKELTPADRQQFESVLKLAR